MADVHVINRGGLYGQKNEIFSKANKRFAVGNKVDSPRAVQFQKWSNGITDIYATSIDYDSKAQTTKVFLLKYKISYIGQFTARPLQK